MVFFGHFTKKSNNDVTVIYSETKLTNSKIFKPYYLKPYFKYDDNTFKPKNILGNHEEQETKKSMATNKHV